jgi:DNA-binding transcriptional LysR family regulator
MSDRNLSAVDLNLLVAFDALMLERNVTRAAARLGLSQSAMSKALNRLRDMFEDPLFVRSSRGMQPTPRASSLVAPIRSALADISRTLTPASFVPAEAVGTVRIAVVDMYETMLLPLVIRRLRTEALGVDLQVRSLERWRLREQLASAEVDIAIAPLGSDDADLHTQMLWRDHLLTLVADKSPLAKGMTAAEFAAAGHIVDAGLVQLAPDGTGNSVVDAMLASRGLRRRLVVVLPSLSSVPAIVASTDLVATLPSKIARALGAMPGVHILEPPLPLLEVTSHMIWHRRSHATPLAAWMRAVIVETAATL